MEMIAFGYYTEDNTNHTGHHWIRLEDYAAEFDKEEYGDLSKDKFLEHIRGEEELQQFVNGEMFDCVAYYGWYNKFDCIVLRKGVEKFTEMLCEFTRRTTGNAIDVRGFLTISRFSDYYFSQRGCYDGVHELSGGTRNYVHETSY